MQSRIIRVNVNDKVNKMERDMMDVIRYALMMIFFAMITVMMIAITVISAPIVIYIIKGY